MLKSIQMFMLICFLSNVALAETDDNSLIVDGITLEFYRAFQFFTHAAIKIEDKEDNSFWQIELQRKSEYTRIKRPQFKEIRTKLTFMGVPTNMGNVILYNNAEERKSLEKKFPLMTSVKVCLNGDSPRSSLRWYKDCLEINAENYSEETFKYNVVTNNCGHFAEKILNNCGLTNCYDFPKSNGMLHRKGIFNSIGDNSTK